jgi:hypothetical protein
MNNTPTPTTQTPLIVEPGKSWLQIERDIRKLPYRDLIREYHHYLNLCAKNPQQIKVEIMLEDEIARRSSY